MRTIEVEAQLSLVKELFKRDTMEEQVVEMLLSNIANIRYARDQVALSIIPLDIQSQAVAYYNAALKSLAKLAYRASRHVPVYKLQSLKDFEKRTISRSDLGLSMTRSEDELYDLTIQVRSRLKTALNRFETVIGTEYRSETFEILELLYETAELFNAV